MLGALAIEEYRELLHILPVLKEGKMKKTKLIISVVAALLAILLPFVGIVSIAVLLPPQFSETFVGALNEKYDYLHSVEGEKIVVVGGSSVAFGLDSERLSRYTGMPVVNFGLYAALGTKLMLDLSDSAIGEGDIVILAPELDPETFSLYFNSDTTLKALDDDFSMFFDVDIDNWPGILSSMWEFSYQKWQRYTGMVQGSSADSGIYLSKYINKYGDYYSDSRTENIMPMYYDPNTMIDLSGDNFSQNLDAFIEYLNKYIATCKSKGAEVYFSWCPMNELAIVERDSLARESFLGYLEEKIACDFISDIDDYIMDAGYFYDTNFHLNNDGALARSIRLAKDIIAAHGMSKVVTDEEPCAPVLPGSPIDFPTEDTNSDDFIYSLITEGELRGYYAIVGLSPDAEGKTNLVIPLGVDGRRVALIKSEAFYGSEVRNLYIQMGTTKLVLEDGVLTGAERLSDIWIESDNPDAITPPGDFGTSKEILIHVPPETEYSSHPVWNNLGIALRFDASLGKDESTVLFDKTYSHIDENEVYFTYSEITMGYYAGAYVITGLSELGKAQDTLTIPSGANGVKVVGISLDAFLGITASTLIIPKDTNIKYIENGAFKGASSLSHLWLYVDSGDVISPPNSFAGVANDFVVHVPKGSGFESHYYWGERNLDFYFDAN